MNDHTSSSYPWALDDIPYNQIDFDRIRGQERLFFLVTAASFVEIAADLYTLNLVSYYQDDAVVCRWLRDHWAHEEVLHGHRRGRIVCHLGSGNRCRPRDLMIKVHGN